MMNKEQLQQDIDAMREKLALMEAKLQEQEQEKKKKYFIPEVGEKYWVIDGVGDIYFEINDGEDYDIHKIAVGNCYETPAEAKKADAKQKAYVRIIRALRDHEEDGEVRNYVILYSNELSDYLSCAWSCEVIFFGNPSKKMFSTENACDWVIDNMQDDLNIYFGE